MRKFLVAAIAVVVAAPFASAETFFGRITEVDGNKITVQKRKAGDRKKGEQQKGKKGKKGKGKKRGFGETETVTLTVAENCSFNVATFDFKAKKMKKGGTLEGGLKGIAARIERMKKFLKERQGKGDKGKGDKGKGKGKGKGKSKGRPGGFRFTPSVTAQITTNAAGQVTEINVIDFRGGFKKKKKKADA